MLGEARDVELYEVDLYVGDWLLPGVIVVSNERMPEVLLGRNVLNELALLLDGPSQTAEVRPSRTKR